MDITENIPFSLGAQLESVAGSLQDSYFAHRRIHHISTRLMPSRDEIYEITQQLFALIYPGFFGRLDLAVENIDSHLRDLLENLSKGLYLQIYNSLSYKSQNDDEMLKQRASQVTKNFFKALPEIRELLEGDVLAGFKGDPAAQDTDVVIFSYPATIAIGTYRLAHALWNMQVPLLPRVMTEQAHSLTGIDIHPGAGIGRNFFIDHGTGVVIGETTVIGDNCKLYQGVTLGAVSFPHNDEGQIIRGNKRHPTLEDDVIVYSNTSILGDVTIGKGATIGGNIFLTRSIPPGCTVTAKQAELHYRNRHHSLDRGVVTDYQI